MKKFDFEKLSDPVEAENVYAPRQAVLEQEINKLLAHPRRYTNLDVKQKTQELQQEFIDRQTAFSQHMQSIREGWVKDYGKTVMQMNSEETAADKEVLKALREVKRLCLKRSRLAIMRWRRQRKYSDWADLSPEDKHSTRSRNVTVMSHPIHIFGGDLDESARQSVGEVFSSYLGFAADNDLEKLLKDE